MMITTLKIIFTFLLVWIIYIVISTSLTSSLFEEWDFLSSIPWMKATLWDFYINVFVIYCWILYKESSILSKLIWLILMVCLGSIASCIYILIALFSLKKGEGVKELLINNK